MSWLLHPYAGGKKRNWAIGIAAVWTWLPWLFGEAMQIPKRWSFGSALWYFILVAVALWGVLFLVDWVRHRVTKA